MNVDNFAAAMSVQVENAIKKAFISGFQYAQSLNLNDDEFVDLGLPSGTKWSKEFLGVTDATPDGDFFSYIDSQKYSLPTEEQVKELSDNCSFYQHGDFMSVIGPNGNELVIKANKVLNYGYGSLTESCFACQFPASNCKAAYSFWVRNVADETPKIGKGKCDSYENVKIDSASAKYCKYQIRLVKCAPKANK